MRPIRVCIRVELNLVLRMGGRVHPPNAVCSVSGPRSSVLRKHLNCRPRACKGTHKRFTRQFNSDNRPEQPHLTRMNRRHFVQVSLAALASTQLGTVAALGQPVPPEAPKPGSPLITAPTPDGVVIVWPVDVPSTGWVEYGETEALGNVARGAVDGLRPYDGRAIFVTLTGLRGGARVFYRTVTVPVNFPNHYKMTRGTAMVSPTYSFTLPGPGPTAKVAIWNDTHQQPDTLPAVQELTEEFAPDLLVWNGDVVADQFMAENDLVNSFLRPGNGVEPASIRPMLFVRGNHDTRGAVARHLPGYVPKPLTNGYQNLLRVGPVGIIVLDTGEDKEGPQYYADLGEWANYRQAQKVWLESAIKHPLFKSAPHKIVCCHIPLRWKQPDEAGAWCPDGDERWSPLLARGRVQAVFSGHTHQFWHSAPTATRPYHQIIGGGPQTKSTNWSPTPATVVKLEADKKTLSVEVVEARSRSQLLSLKLKS